MYKSLFCFIVLLMIVVKQFVYNIRIIFIYNNRNKITFKRS